MRIALIAAGGAVLVVVAIVAVLMFRQGPADVAGKWGLLGEWKLNCQAPTSPNNVSIEFVVRDDKLFQDRTAGTVRDTTAITAVGLNSDGMLETTEVSPTTPPTTRQIVRRKQGEGRFAVWSNRAAGSEQYSIKDGKFANGGTAPALTRCRAGGKTS